MVMSPLKSSYEGVVKVKLSIQTNKELEEGTAAEAEEAEVVITAEEAGG